MDLKQGDGSSPITSTYTARRRRTIRASATLAKAKVDGHDGDGAPRRSVDYDDDAGEYRRSTPALNVRLKVVREKIGRPHSAGDLQRRICGADAGREARDHHRSVRRRHPRGKSADRSGRIQSVGAIVRSAEMAPSFVGQTSVCGGLQPAHFGSSENRAGGAGLKVRRQAEARPTSCEHAPARGHILPYDGTNRQYETPHLLRYP